MYSTTYAQFLVRMMLYLAQLMVQALASMCTQKQLLWLSNSLYFGQLSSTCRALNRRVIPNSLIRLNTLRHYLKRKRGMRNRKTLTQTLIQNQMSMSSIDSTARDRAFAVVAVPDILAVRETAQLISCSSTFSVSAWLSPGCATTPSLLIDSTQRQKSSRRSSLFKSFMGSLISHG